MKKFLLLATFIPFLLQSQEKEVFKDEQASIVESERKAAEALLSAGMQSVASGNYNVHHYRCEWQIDPAVRYIRGKITVSFTMTQSGNTIMLDMVNQLITDSVVYHGNKINFNRPQNNGLEIQFPAAINANARDSVSIYYQGDPAGGGFGAFFQGTHAGVPVIWTLSQPYGAKDWWPCKDDLTDKADSIDIIITHPSGYMASANGIVAGRQSAGSNIITHWRHRYRIATYLIAIAITNYVERTDTVRVGDKVYNYLSYAYPESAGTFFNSEVLYSKVAFRIFSTLFGEYPFAAERYGHTQFGWGGGMEHQTNSFMFNTSPNLSAHELAHQWFGDKVTCGSWQHIWLNEGFATYLTAIFLQYGFPASYRPFLQNTLNSVVSQPGGSVFVPDTTNVGRIFDGRLSYNKGAYVVHMLRWVLGDSSFFKGLRQYLEDPALRYNFAKTADLQRHLEQVSGKNLSTFFDKWVYKEGYANYTASWYQAPGSPWVTVKLNQTTSHNSVSFFEMPVELGFRVSPTVTVRMTADHRYSGQVFSFNVGQQIDSLIIDPDLWILAKTKTTSKSSVELLPPDDLQLFPNPSPGNAVLRLRNATGNRLTVRVFNAAGQLLFKREAATAPGAQIEMKIPFMQYPKGLYLVDIRNDRNLKVIRRIVH